MRIIAELCARLPKLAQKCINISSKLICQYAWVSMLIMDPLMSWSVTWVALPYVRTFTRAWYLCIQRLVTAHLSCASNKDLSIWDSRQFENSRIKNMFWLNAFMEMCFFICLQILLLGGRLFTVGKRRAKRSPAIIKDQSPLLLDSKLFGKLHKGFSCWKHW